jgi:hypothetical protein
MPDARLRVHDREKARSWQAADGSPVHRYDFVPPAGDDRRPRGDGQRGGPGVGLVGSVRPARDIVRAIADEAARVLAGLASGTPHGSAG